MTPNVAPGPCCQQCSRSCPPPVELHPNWRCPDCGISAEGLRDKLAQMSASVGVSARVWVLPPFAMDRAAWSLVEANAVTLVMAWYLDWQLTSLMLVYWCQSVLIGVSNIFRMLALKNFLATVEMNGKKMPPTRSTQWKLSAFFALHYGLFHAAYLAFIFDGPLGRPPSPDFLFWVCVACFAISQVLAFHDARNSDRQGLVDIGTLFFGPYLRIIPMHLTIVLGGVFRTGSVLLFCALKTLADVGMHGFDRRRLIEQAVDPTEMKQ